MTGLAIYLALSGYALWCILTAPMGWQSPDGFHFGEPDQ